MTSVVSPVSGTVKSSDLSGLGSTTSSSLTLTSVSVWVPYSSTVTASVASLLSIVVESSVAGVSVSFCSVVVSFCSSSLTISGVSATTASSFCPAAELSSTGFASPPPAVPLPPSSVLGSGLTSSVVYSASVAYSSVVGVDDSFRLSCGTSWLPIIEEPSSLFEIFPPLPLSTGF